MIEALGPELGGKKTTHPQTGDVTLSCSGFNHKTNYDRQIPCDQDFLRKFARNTEQERLHAWFNREVLRCLRSLKLLDPEGLLEQRKDRSHGTSLPEEKQKGRLKKKKGSADLLEDWRRRALHLLDFGHSRNEVARRIRCYARLSP